MGYHRAGFDVTGVDIEPHADYPFPMIVADAMDVLTDLAFLGRFEVKHASPPCPRYSAARTIGTYDPEDKPDLVGPVREALFGHTWVMENVPGAPMPAAVTYCGWGVGLKHIRLHRLFESSAFILSPGCACPDGDSISVFGHSGEDRRKTTLAANGGRKGTHVPTAEVRELMGVQWMRSRDDVSDAIPPAYTEHIGAQLIAHLAERAA
jgi:DNA (cytosine-5)-methyltransferase 1